LQEIAENAALSFNPYDQNDLINAILKILNDNSLREKFIQLGTDRLKHFSWDKSAKELMHLFKKAIS
jgi:glycosyltransferase involved in cell wall biosynthesis